MTDPPPAMVSSPPPEASATTVTASPTTSDFSASSILSTTSKPPTSSKSATTLPPRTVKALFTFAGYTEYDELSFTEGDILTVVRERVAEGWWLAEKDGVCGLVPESYLSYGEGQLLGRPPSPHRPSPPFQSPVSSLGRSFMGSRPTEHDASFPTGGLPNRTPTGFSTTGSIRSLGTTGSSNALLAKRQLNRFSYYVTSGAEEFILAKHLAPKPSLLTPEDQDDLGDNLGDPTDITESDKHHVEEGPSWKSKAPRFYVYVHDPERRTKMGGMQEYTIFHLTSEFTEDVQVTVERRFSQFTWLHSRLATKFSALILPSLPEKQFSGRFNEEFIERRRRALERYINRVARHPIIRYSEILTHFLSCDDETEWRRKEKYFEGDSIQGSKFFEHVYHAEFNVDQEDGDKEKMDRFHAFTRAIDRYLPTFTDSAHAYKEGLLESKQRYRKLGMGLLRLISGSSEDEEHLLTEEGIWCWRDGCTDCMVRIGGIHEEHIEQQFLPWIEGMRDQLGMSGAQAPLVEMHSGAFRKYQEMTRYMEEDENEEEDPLTQEDEGSDSRGIKADPIAWKDEDFDAEEIKSRCETVFNVTLAESDRYHGDRVEDYRQGAMDLLDAQISLHERILGELREARATFEAGPYEEQGEVTRRRSEFAHLLEDAPIIRPVSVSSVSTVMGGDGRWGGAPLEAPQASFPTGLGEVARLLSHPRFMGPCTRTHTRLSLWELHLSPFRSSILHPLHPQSSLTMQELDFASGSYREQLSLLQPFVHRAALADQVEDVVKVVGDALAIPGLALYGPLLRENKHSSLLLYSWNLSVIEEKDQYPILTPPLAGKLRQLSLINLGKHRSNLRYEEVARCMGLSDTHELEEVMVEAMEKGLVKGRLDQHGQQFYLTQCLPREISLPETGELLSILRAWADRVDGRAQELERHISHAKEVSSNSTRERWMERTLLRLKAPNKGISMTQESEGDASSGASKRERRQDPTASDVAEWQSEDYIRESARLDAMDEAGGQIEQDTFLAWPLRKRWEDQWTGWRLLCPE
ncbi:hypothetical protein BJ684DRAFT_16841 [Piptocephalis cylindrospora]|uniref:PX domain-containing protein n=1 Tax=Piptocephalis cylindrospora TaxID=1907219 RepID=A0A4P9Y4E0_9FUNG|nr:hypothetical protein BJ684DRAFT_16841 [Piptocephalis cylindrospora]|eukprot:RKP12700.1 hypothetical protein BJ684DRAFT_16841 [Piptocephalis cylindrospora]